MNEEPTQSERIKGSVLLFLLSVTLILGWILHWDIKRLPQQLSFEFELELGEDSRRRSPASSEPPSGFHGSLSSKTVDNSTAKVIDSPHIRDSTKDSKAWKNQEGKVPGGPVKPTKSFVELIEWDCLEKEVTIHRDQEGYVRIKGRCLSHVRAMVNKSNGFTATLFKKESIPTTDLIRLSRGPNVIEIDWMHPIPSPFSRVFEIKVSTP